MTTTTADELFVRYLSLPKSEREALEAKIRRATELEPLELNEEQRRRYREAIEEGRRSAREEPLLSVEDSFAEIRANIEKRRSSE